MEANSIEWLNWRGLEECKYQNIPGTMASTPSPPTRGDLENCNNKKVKRGTRKGLGRGRGLLGPFLVGAVPPQPAIKTKHDFCEKKPGRLSHSKRDLSTNCLPVVEQISRNG